jgi:hypothetical protein
MWLVHFMVNIAGVLQRYLVTDSQPDGAYNCWRADPPHFELILWDVPLVGVSRRCLDQNKVEVIINKPAGRNESERYRHTIESQIRHWLCRWNWSPDDVPFVLVRPSAAIPDCRLDGSPVSSTHSPIWPRIQ